MPFNLNYSYADQSYLDFGVLQTVTGKTDSGGLSTVSVTLTNSRAGSSLVALVSSNASTNGAFAIADNLGQAWSGLEASLSGTAPTGLATFHLDNNRGGPLVITATMLSTSLSTIIIYEVGGGPLTYDQTATGHSLSVSDSVTTGTLTKASEIIFGFASNKTAKAFYTSSENGFVTVNSGAGSLDVYTGGGYKIATDINPVTLNFTQAVSGSWNTLAATYYKTSLRNLNSFIFPQYSQAAGDDGAYFIEYGSEYMIREYKYKNANNTDTVTFTWKGRSTESTQVSPVLIQIYNVTTAAWETLARETRVGPDIDFQATVTQSANLANYYDGNNTVTFRSYQQVI